MTIDVDTVLKKWTRMERYQLPHEEADPTQHQERSHGRVTHALLEISQARQTDAAENPFHAFPCAVWLAPP